MPQKVLCLKANWDLTLVKFGGQSQLLAVSGAHLQEFVACKTAYTKQG